MLPSIAKRADRFLPWAILTKGGQWTGRWGGELMGAAGLFTFVFVLIKLDHDGLDGRFYHGGSHFNSVKAGFVKLLCVPGKHQLQGLSAKTRRYTDHFFPCAIPKRDLWTGQW
jgi:hypothetical protein